MITDPFPSWLKEVAADPIVVRPDDIDAEARGNLRSFSLDREQARVATPAGVENFALGVIEGRRVWLAARGAAPMILYWWHDAQAGQLRFSLVSASHERLPFGCDTARCESIRAVAADWLGSPHLHGIPFDSLCCAAPGEKPSRSSRHILPVWSVHVP